VQSDITSFSEGNDGTTSSDSIMASNVTYVQIETVILPLQTFNDVASTDAMLDMVSFVAVHDLQRSNTEAS
jgi:uncharacterized protein YebE (UPF0316 family)